MIFFIKLCIFVCHSGELQNFESFSYVKIDCFSNLCIFVCHSGELQNFESFLYVKIDCFSKLCIFVCHSGEPTSQQPDLHSWSTKLHYRRHHHHHHHHHHRRRLQQQQQQQQQQQHQVPSLPFSRYSFFLFTHVVGILLSIFSRSW